MSLARAIATGDLAELPSRRDEDWRWTDLRGLIRAMPAASPGGRARPRDQRWNGLADVEVGNTNGQGATDLDVPAGQQAFWIWRFMAVTADSAHASEFFVDVGEDAKLTLVEMYEGFEPDYIRQVTAQFTIAPGAKVERIIVCEDTASAVTVSSATISLAADSEFSQTVLTTGARRQRIETHVAHPGGGASARLDGVYLLDDQRHSDITTVVTHAGTNGTTDQLTKGVVGGQGRGVFQGRIVVEPGADQTDARMGHHALLLSDRAEVDAKPELEIFADDVACAHGNTVGALDEEALFYAEQRGIPEADARAMLTEAFVAEVVDRIEHAGARDVARAWVAARLGGTQ